MTVAVLTAGIVSLPALDAGAAAPTAPTDAVETPAIQRPAALREPTGETAPVETGRATEGPPAGEPGLPDAPVDSAGEAPDIPAGTPSGGDASVAQPTEPAAEATSEAVPLELLEADQEAASPRPPPPTAAPDPLEDPSTSLTADYSNEYRPAHNPGRLNIGLRTLFANAGGPQEIGGRMGGLQVDLGQAWNNFGYGVTASAWGGRIFLPRETGAEMNAMFGAGPSISLGRRALVGRGYLDLQLGYDFFYGVVNQRRDNPTVVAPQGDPDVVLEQAQNLAPHGPRATLDMGLIMLDSNRRFFHGVGVSMGYQGLIGSFRGELPFTHMLTLGLSYWMG